MRIPHVLLFQGWCIILLSLANDAEVFSVQAVTAADFLPPIRGGADVVSDRSSIKDEGKTIAASSAQDAVVAATDANIAEIQQQTVAGKSPEKSDQENLEAVDIGAHFINFPSGQGVVATGMSVYKISPNPNASRVTQRNAYVKAYMNAKSSLVRLIGNTSVEGVNVLKAVSTTLNQSDRKTTEATEITEEQLKTAGNALLKGYVVFSIREIKEEDDGDVRSVFVTIASSPKTMSLSLRNGATQSVKTMTAGIQNVLDEVQSGIVPPIGGRVITVPATGESAVIGFGSAIVQDGASTAISAKNRLTSRIVSGTRARDSLNGMINGDKTMWSTGISEKTEQGFKEGIVYAASNDPMSAAGEITETIDSFEEQFLSSQTARSEITSIRKGILPPGITEKHWFSEDGHWSYTMVVYYPGLTSKAAEFAKSMREATLNSPIGSEFPSGRGKRLDVKPLDGGVVSPEKDF